MSFPTTLPSYTITGGTEHLGDTSGGLGISGLLNAFEVDITALGTKMGTGASTPASGKVLRASGTGTSVWGAVVLTTDVTGTLPVANGGTGVTSSTGTGNTVLSGSPTIVTPTIADFTNANHNHSNAAGGGNVGASGIDWSTLSLNMKGATNSGTTITNADQDLAAQGLTLSFTVASNCNALVSVSLGILSASDFEFRPEIRLGGAVYTTFSPAAATSVAGRASARGFTYVVPLVTGVNVLSAGVFISGGSSLSMQAGAGSISALVLGRVTA